MCLQCDGYTYEEAMRSVDLTIRTYGWQLTLVDDREPWAYTVGLLESYGHPELVVVDCERPAQVELINWAVGQIERDGAISELERHRADVEIVTVHDVHLAGDWFGTWANHYGEMPPSGSFVQLIAPPSWFCDCHQHAQRRLDRADCRPTGNRASRRSASRARRR